MEEIKEEAIHHTALKLADEIKNLSIYKSFYSDVQKLVSSPNVKKEDFKHTLQQAMKEKGLDTKLRNAVFHWIRTQSKQNNELGVMKIPQKEDAYRSRGRQALEPSGVRRMPTATTQLTRARRRIPADDARLDPLTSLQKASTQWEKRIHKSLNSMCTDLETSLAKIRSQHESEELAAKWNELSTFTIDLTKYRPVYAPKDFLEVLLTLSGYVPFTKEDEPKWEFAHLPLQVKTLDQLRATLSEWAGGPGGPCGAVADSAGCERASLGARVAALGYAPVAQEFLKKGSPQSLRAKLWAQVLGADIKAQQVAYFNQLKKSVLEVDLMVDKLIFKDVQLTASNDDQYFVFEDLLFQVMLCFSRDAEVLAALRGAVGSPPSVAVRGRATHDALTVFPPSGIIPFHGFTMYATPFCYLYDDPVQLYFTFRAFYIRYWHRLHYISTHPQGIVSLCLLYERLLEANEPLLWIHFRNININPIRVVFKWLMRAFSGHLPPDQLLLLWDAILGYDCLEILPLLALAILSFRKENIFQVNTIQSVDAVLADLSTISVIPLLQLALMQT